MGDQPVTKGDWWRLVTEAASGGSEDLVEALHIISAGIFVVRGDSRTDDTVEFERQVDRANAAGGMVLASQGNFVVNRNLEFADNTEFQGSGASTLITFGASIDRGITNLDRVGGNTRIRISNLRLDGANLCNDPIELVNCTDSAIDRVWVTRGNHDAIELESCTRCTVSNSFVDNSNTFDGIELDSCVDCLVTGCLSHSNQQDGFNMSGTSDHNSVLSCYSFDNTRAGFLTASGASRNTVFGYADSNTPNFSDSGTNNLFQVMGGDRFDFSANDVVMARFRGDGAYLGAPATEPASGNMPNSSMTFHVTSGGTVINFKVKDSGGTVRSANLTLT